VSLVDGTIDSGDLSKLVGQRGCLLLVFLAIFVLMRRSSSRVIALVLAAGVVLSACSSTDRSAAPAEEEVVATEQVTESVEEFELESDSDVALDQETVLDSESDFPSQSVGGFTPDTKTCPEKSSFTFVKKIVNETPLPLVLSAGEYTCNDWSGVSTPGRAFNDLLLKPGESTSVRLEMADNVSRKWTLAVRQDGAGGYLGTIRITVPPAPEFLFHKVNMSGAQYTSAPEGHGRLVSHCDVLDLARTNELDTPGSEWNWIHVYYMLSFVVFDGNVAAASNCNS
jgi:hypothetical protein